MAFIFKLLIIGYSFFYQYETPTYPGTYDLYSSNIWYMPALLAYSNYKFSITLTGILPYSFGDLKHSDISGFYRVRRFYIFSGLKFRNLSQIYSEGSGVVGGAVKLRNFAVSLDVRAILQSLKNDDRFIKSTLDASFIFKHRPFILGYCVFNILRPTLDFSQGEKSNMGERALFALNYPQSVFFTVGYEKEEHYETPFLSTEVWFTHGFNVVFGLENSTVEGGIGLRSANMAINIRIKSHTILGPTYITQLTFYRE